MATTTLTVDTPFTPAATPFRLQCTGGDVFRLFSRGADDEEWVFVDVILNGKDTRIDNPVAGVDYKIQHSGRTGLTLVMKMDQ